MRPLRGILLAGVDKASDTPLYLQLAARLRSVIDRGELPRGRRLPSTRTLASELGPHGITVNCVAPGWVDTDMSADPLRKRRELERIVEAIPLRRVATADDVAGPILFLASELARHITGEVVNVNGGSVLCG